MLQQNQHRKVISFTDGKNPVRQTLAVENANSWECAMPHLLLWNSPSQLTEISWQLKFGFFCRSKE